MLRRRTNLVIYFAEIIILLVVYMVGKIQKMSSFNRMILAIGIIALIYLEPVGVIHHHKCINDFVWFHVVYKGITYIQDDVTGEIVKGTKKKFLNKEFWKFENHGNRNWKLCDMTNEENKDLKRDFKLVNEF